MTRMAKSARTLEDLFFYRMNRELQDRHRELARMEHNRRSLSEVSGITGKAILDRLLEVGITPEVLATLAVLPLAEVAWADGRVQKAERDAVLSGAASFGMARGEVDSAILEQWLRRRPPRQLREAWTTYISGLCEGLSPAQRRVLADKLVCRARDVAQAAGKILGIGSGIAAAEKAALARMEEAILGHGQWG